jgi:hypothetical protein
MKSEILKGRPVSDATKKRIEKAMGLGLSISEAADLVGCSVAAVKRAIAVDPAGTKLNMGEKACIKAGLYLLACTRKARLPDHSYLRTILDEKSTIGTMSDAEFENFQSLIQSSELFIK